MPVLVLESKTYEYRSNLLESIGAALILGFSVGPACLGSCSAFYVPMLLAEKRDGLDGSFRFFTFFSAGRLLGYAAVGLLVGLLAEWTSEVVADMNWLPGVSEIVAGVLVILYGLWRAFPEASLCKKLHKKDKPPPSAFIIGLATGLSLCPPFVAAIIGAGATGDILSSVLFFVAFFFGATIWFLPLTFIGLLSKFQQMRKFGHWAAVVSGVIFIVLGIYHASTGTYL